MTTNMWGSVDMIRKFFYVTVLFLLVLHGNVYGEQSHADLAKQSQNPIANLISLPFQNNIFLIRDKITVHHIKGRNFNILKSDNNES